MRYFLFGALAVFVALPGAAHEYAVGNLFIYHPYSHPTPAGATSVEGYIAVTNNGDVADRLTGARFAAANVTLRQTIVEAEEVHVKEIDGIDLPPGETVTMAPGGLHILFDKLQEPFVIGDRFNVTLMFARAGDVTLEFWVEARSAQPAPTKDGREPSRETDAPETASNAAHVAISDLLKSQLGVGLEVSPVTVVGMAAVAGWWTGETGGRAFLRKEGDDWTLRLLSGASLVTPAGLQAQGLSPAAARRLHGAAVAAEANMPAAVRRRLDDFVGTVFVDQASR